jgi:hypothetical protein
VEEFRSLGQKFVAAWQEAGVRTYLTKTPDLDHFRQASPKIQLAALSYLEFNLEVMNEMKENDDSLLNTKRFLWRALKKLEFVPPSDMMDHIEDEDVVEVYLTDEIQVFRNWKFLEIVSVTIEDLLCLPWHKLGTRGWKPLLAMFRFILRFKLGLIKETTPWNIPEHPVREINSVENIHFMIRLKYFIPLRQNGKIVATLSTNTSQLIKRTEVV